MASPEAGSQKAIRSQNFANITHIESLSQFQKISFWSFDYNFDGNEETEETFSKILKEN